MISSNRIALLAPVISALLMMSFPAMADSLFGKEFDRHIGHPLKKLVPGKLYDAQKDAVNKGLHAIEDGGEKAAKVIVPPVAIALDLVQGDTPEEAFKELVRDYKAAISAAAELQATIAEGWESVVAAGAEVAAGKEAANAVRIANLPNQIIRRVPSAAVDATFKVSEGEDASIIWGIPLTAALEQAHAYYEPKAKPLPGSVRVLLSQGGVLAEEHLNTVRYIVDADGGSIAAVINRIMKQMGQMDGGENHAVTVGNIVVFTREPNHGLEDLHFWAHEVQHTVQYAQWGFEKFAWRYMNDFKAVEADADRVADAVVKEVVRITEVLMAATGK